MFKKFNKKLTLIAIFTILPIIITFCQWFFLWNIYSISQKTIVPLNNSLFAIEELQLTINYDISNVDELRRNIHLFISELEKSSINKGDSLYILMKKITQNVKETDRTIVKYKEEYVPSSKIDREILNEILENELNFKVQTIKASLEEMLITLVQRQNAALGCSAFLSLIIMLLYVFTVLKMTLPIRQEYHESKSDIEDLEDDENTKLSETK